MGIKVSGLTDQDSVIIVEETGTKTAIIMGADEARRMADMVYALIRNMRAEK